MQATLKARPDRRRLLLGTILVALLAVTFAPAPIAAPSDLRSAPAVLVMVHDPGCPYCARWEAEVGHSYSASVECTPTGGQVKV
jgi:hypothetical protein